MPNSSTPESELRLPTLPYSLVVHPTDLSQHPYMLGLVNGWAHHRPYVRPIPRGEDAVRRAILERGYRIAYFGTHAVQPPDVEGNEYPTQVGLDEDPHDLFMVTNEYPTVSLHTSAPPTPRRSPRFTDGFVAGNEFTAGEFTAAELQRLINFNRPATRISPVLDSGAGERRVDGNSDYSITLT